jgi:hypothetical protein
MITVGLLLLIKQKYQMIKSDFREWTLDKIDEVFGLEYVIELPSLNQLLSFEYDANTEEANYLNKIKNTYFRFGGESWNEVELENKIISPLFVYAEMDNQKFAYFLERPLFATIGDYELSGRVDGMIATGFRNPKQPYFCMNEYKKAKDPDGDPQGQALIAMLVAQHLNNNKQTPIYGCYVVGRQWIFMALEGKKYTFSKSFTVDDDEIFDIYRILKSLKWHIEQQINRT